MRYVIVMFDFINEKTGFANGDLFINEAEIREYFTIENMENMFEVDNEISQADLDEMAKIVISNKWHIKGD